METFKQMKLKLVMKTQLLSMHCYLEIIGAF